MADEEQGQQSEHFFSLAPNEKAKSIKKNKEQKLRINIGNVNLFFSSSEIPIETETIIIKNASGIFILRTIVVIIDNFFINF